MIWKNAVALTLIVCTTTFGATPPDLLVIFDRTGSVANEAAIADVLFQALQDLAAKNEIGVLRVIIWSEGLLSSKELVVELQCEKKHVLVQMQEAGCRPEIEKKLAAVKESLISPLRNADCTSIADLHFLLNRSRRVQPIVVSDFVHDCKQAKVAPELNDRTIYFVVASSKGDRGNYSDFFRERESQLRKIYPNGRIFFESQLQGAIQEALMPSEVGNSQKLRFWSSSRQ